MLEAIVVGFLLLVLASVAVGRQAERGRSRARGGADFGPGGVLWGAAAGPGDGGDTGGGRGSDAGSGGPASGDSASGDCGGGDGGGGCD